MELKGKIINFLGDSITEGVGVEDLNNRYDNRLKEATGAACVNNYGISGTRIAHQRKSSEKPRFDLCFCGRAWDLNKDADIVVVFGGTNDYGHGDAPFGSMADNTPDTYCGAVEYLMNLLKELHTDAQIVFMTPARREGDLNPSADASKTEAKPLADYVGIIKIKGKEHGIAVLDLYENLGVNPNDAKEKEMLAPDGLHFNDDGHKIIAECLMDFLKNL